MRKKLLLSVFLVMIILAVAVSPESALPFA